MQDTHENNMNAGPGRPSGGGGRNRRRRGRRPPNRGGHGAGRDRQQHGGIYTAPMDHSYRAAFGGNGPRPGRQRPGFAPSYAQAEPEPLPQREDANSQAEIQTKKGNFDHWISLPRAGRSEAESARSRMRHGAAALGVLPEPSAIAAPPRRSGRGER